MTAETAVYLFVIGFWLVLMCVVTWALERFWDVR